MNRLLLVAVLLGFGLPGFVLPGPVLPGFVLLGATPAAAQTLRIALREDADRLDPTFGRTYVGRVVFAGLCDKLFDIDDKQRIVPQLATSYEWPDPRTLVIRLRPGVLFQDGTKLDAEAVRFSLQRYLTMPGSFRADEINAIASVEVDDPLTVRVHLGRQSATLLAQLTDRAGMIVSPAAARAAGADFARAPVCAGPFGLAERIPHDRIVLRRFPGYWDAGSIHFDRVIYQPMADSSVRLANLIAGAVDISEQIVPADADAVRGDPRLRLVISDALGYYGITNNLANGPRANTPYGRDPRVRKALELSIDRTALLRQVYNGLFMPTAQAFSAQSPYYAPEVRPLPRDLARARALLAEAGVKIPLVVNLLFPESPDIRQVAEAIRAMAAEAGFDIRPQPMEFAASLDATERGDYEAYLLSWSGRTDPDGNMWGVLHGGAADNRSGYDVKEVNGLLDQARLISDTGQRRALYARVAAREAEDLPITYLWTTRNIIGLSAKIAGFVPVSDGMIRLQGMRLLP